MTNDEKEREIKRLSKLLQMKESAFEQLKLERRAALDRAFDLESQLKIMTEERDHYENAYADSNREMNYDPCRFSCPNCQEHLEQYEKMRAAFERRKQDQRAIASALKANNWSVDNKPLTLTRLIKMGKHVE